MSGCSCGTCAACSAGGSTPLQARGRTLMERLAPRVDKLRQRYATMGVRVYDVHMVWTRWGGKERGEGAEKEVLSIPIYPRPEVRDLTSVSLNPYTAGILPVGSVRVEQVSLNLTEDNLRGLALPGRAYLSGCGLVQPGGGTAITALEVGPIAVFRATESDYIPQPYEFFYEVYEGGTRNKRRKFRLLGEPFKKPDAFGWTLVLERISEDRDRDGLSQVGPDRGEY